MTCFDPLLNDIADGWLTLIPETATLEVAFVRVLERCLSQVPPEAWAFPIGGYLPAQKWLKDRRGRALSYEEQAHYPRLIAALAETGRLMAAIDNDIEAAGGWPLK